MEDNSSQNSETNPTSNSKTERAPIETTIPLVALKEVEERVPFDITSTPSISKKEVEFEKNTPIKTTSTSSVSQKEGETEKINQPQANTVGNGNGNESDGSTHQQSLPDLNPHPKPEPEYTKVKLRYISSNPPFEYVGIVKYFGPRKFLSEELKERFKNFKLEGYFQFIQNDHDVE